MKKAVRSYVICALGAIVLAFALVACGGAGMLKQELLEEASGVKVVAEGAGAGQSVKTDDAIVVEPGDRIVISPCLENGSFHLTIASSDGTVVYDDDASGKVLYAIAADPGTYSVTTSGNNATGWMTVFAQGADELAAQNATLNETLAQVGMDVNEVLSK